MFGIIPWATAGLLCFPTGLAYVINYVISYENESFQSLFHITTNDKTFLPINTFSVANKFLENGISFPNKLILSYLFTIEQKYA